MESYPGLLASGCFIQTLYHMMFIPIHGYDSKHNFASRNNRITLSKANVMKTFSNLDDVHLFWL